MTQHPAGRRRLPFRILLRDRRGVAAVLFALMLPTLLLSTGAAVDFARVGMLKTSLQAVTDGAALAGASALCLTSGSTDPTQAATDYYNKGTVPIGKYANLVSMNVSIPSNIEVTVTATAKVNNTLMQLVGMNETVTVTSSAEGPAYVLSVTKTGGFTASAADSNSIYEYVVPSDGSVPTSTASMKLLFTNDPAVDPNYAADNAAAKSISVGANDYIGFALVNKTGGIQSYSPNAYGAKAGSTHYFYTSLPVPSQNAYANQGTFYTGQNVMQYYGWYQSRTVCQTTAISGVVTDHIPTSSSACTPHPCTELNGRTVLQNNLLINGSCSTQSSATQTCLQLANNPVSFAFNDMGGGADDFDYNDANFTESCTPSSTSASNPNAVILVN